MKRAIATRPRTYLRRPVVGDAAEFVARVLANDDHLLPFVHAVRSQSAYRQWLSRGRQASTEQFLVCDRATDEIAGFVNLNNLTRGSLQSAAAGWAAFPPLDGQGHLTAGLEMVVELAFTQLRLHRVEANIQPANARSRALAARVGFWFEGFSPQFLQIGGEWRDHERWAIHEPAWRERRRASRPVRR